MRTLVGKIEKIDQKKNQKKSFWSKIKYIFGLKKFIKSKFLKDSCFYSSIVDF